MKIVLRLEQLALLVLFVALYAQSGASWWLFAILFFAPDLSFAAYLAGARIGAVVYNAMHSWIGVVLLAGASWLIDWQLGYSVAIIWAAHIAFDRAQGYGLKYETGFKDTHLGRIGGS
ncbi:MULTISPECIES: DUF4260 domain-containing protein [unclassified Aminobacter]|uniref:DUF4260 domain-containing protein n=1 Tax=unclassified Aminobacter TaxID=2644704 RepID=UPI000465C978|nr:MULTISPECIES: DUF4260 domain-containing protein [unclassified Aminobacter]TWG50077.1 uncharacterized protein DUF4260 [Aminobacter sp. J44]TWH35395.1 uncharacterized protein DUF4260 [Aminobacter sp. J15]